MRKAMAILTATLVLLAAPVWTRPGPVLIAGHGDGGEILGGGMAEREGGVEAQS